MKKISITSKNELFLDDLSKQINLILPSIEILTNSHDASCDMFFVDEDETLAKELSVLYKKHPVILFSQTQKVLDFVDLVIIKPFLLNDFLCSLSSKTLLPKVRHKECITFMEYTFYPVTKEIITPLETIKLTEKEVIILKYLYNRAPETISKEELLKNVWGYSAEMTTHTIETHIYRLRQKVEQNGGSQIIITENSGYRLNI